MKLWILIIIVTIIVIIAVISAFYISMKITPTTNVPNPTLSRLFAIVKNPTKEIETEVQVLVDLQQADELARLDIDSHSFAYKEWCIGGGNDYNVDSKTGRITCTFTETGCFNAQNLIYVTDPKTGVLSIDPSSTYYEWHAEANKGTCVKTFPAMKNVCSAYNYGYAPAVLSCDPATGICSSTRNPSCILTSDYCASKGMDYSDNNGIGDCFLNTAQQIAEMIFGSTLTRKYKQNYSNMINQCKYSSTSSECLSSIAQAVFITEIVSYDSAKDYILNRLNDIQTQCGGLFSSSDSITSNQYIECSVNLTYYGLWLPDQIINLLDGLLCKIPGIHDCNLGMEAQAAIFAFGDDVITHLVNTTKEVGLAISDAFYQVAYGVSKGSTIIYEGIKTFMAAAAQYTKDGAYYVAHGFATAGIAIYNTLNLIYNTVGQGIASVVTACRAISTAFVNGGEEIAHLVAQTIVQAGIDFENALSNLGPTLARAFGPIATAVINEFNNLGGQLAYIGGRMEKGLGDALKIIETIGFAIF
jgi:hypothetical protein